MRLVLEVDCLPPNARLLVIEDNKLKRGGKQSKELVAFFSRSFRG